MNQEIDFPKLMVDCKLAKSKSEAGRLLKYGAVEIDGKKIDEKTIVYFEVPTSWGF